MINRARNHRLSIKFSYNLQQHYNFLSKNSIIFWNSIMTSDSKIKLPLIAELTRNAISVETNRNLDNPILPNSVNATQMLDVHISQIPRNVGAINTSMSFVEGKPVLPAQQQTFLPPSLPGISHFPTYRYQPSDPIHFQPIPMHPLSSHAQFVKGHQPHNNYLVYHLPMSVHSMTPPVTFFPHSQQQSPIMPVNGAPAKPVHKCQRCGTTETPEWRRGPNGLRTLCNACGLFHAKLVKKKGAATAAAEVLNNKVYKGSNGRRVAVKKANFDIETYRRFGSH